jgi:hypothetical protein
MRGRATVTIESTTTAYGGHPHAYGPFFDPKRGIEGPERAPAEIRVLVRVAMGRPPM